MAGSSFGGSIALGLAARRPELFRSITVHEPPLVAIVAGDPDALRQLRPTRASMDAVLAHLGKGEYRQGARQFVEEVAMGPGTWDRLPAAVRETFVHNAPTWLDEQSDPDWAKIDTDALARCAAPVLLSGGTRSPVWLATILDRLPRPCHARGGGPSKGRGTFPTSPIRGGTPPPSRASSGRPETRVPPLVGTVGRDRRSLSAPGSGGGAKEAGCRDRDLPEVRPGAGRTHAALRRGRLPQRHTGRLRARTR
ncbi:alpha/beta fold hydrolase [Streptomyces mirabilis]|uniref:alpha/beta fold hydrolase n=1 Tax=Streptomyces mirabilis TaxID=68239 RepID=UPI003570FD26